MKTPIHRLNQTQNPRTHPLEKFAKWRFFLFKPFVNLKHKPYYMDLRLFHVGDGPDSPPHNYKMKDRLNGWTGLLPCRFLEWTGWYNQSVSQRLLGHYRLFLHFKKNYSMNPRDLAVVQAYILQYRAHHGFKYSISKVMAFSYSIFTWKEYYLVAEVAGVNRLLVNESSNILVEFLTNADTDFEKALTTALQQISEPSFIHKPSSKNNSSSPTLLLNIKNETNHYPTHNYNNDYSNHSQNLYMPIYNHVNTFDLSQELHISIQPNINYGAQGKEKGVFSKHQALIFMDLLASAAKLEKIEFVMPSYKLEGIAEFLQAITGKGKDSWIKELSDYKLTGLYESNTPTRTDNLINTLSTVAETCRKAGFRSVAQLADMKIKELELRKAEQLRQSPS